MPAVRLSALGDSFVEGRGDVGLDGAYRGWVPRFASQLGVPRGAVLNLGTYQATTQDVVERQLPVALARKAPLIGVIVGVNDMVRSWSPERYSRNIHRIFHGLAGMDTTVFTADYPDIPGNLPLPEEFRDLLRTRFAQANEILRDVVAATGAICLDLAGSAEWRAAGMWSEDGLHPSPLGHRRFAEAVAERLAHATDLTDAFAAGALSA